jgi:hypothetical protein
MARGGRSGDRAKRQRWRELVARWRESGETVREFCRRMGVKQSTFYRWRQRLARGGRRQGGHCQTAGNVSPRQPVDVTSGGGGPGQHVAARFLPVQVVLDHGDDLRSQGDDLRSQGNDLKSAGDEGSSGVEIHWGNGRRVRLGRRFDRQTLVEVLSVLEGWPC